MKTFSAILGLVMTVTVIAALFASGTTADQIRPDKPARTPACAKRSTVAILDTIMRQTGGA